MFTGGGSVGCQTLYHLAKRGVTNAVLLEKDQLTAGTTWHTAGLVWRLRPSDVEIQLLSVNFVFVHKFYTLRKRESQKSKNVFRSKSCYTFFSQNLIVLENIGL